MKYKNIREEELKNKVGADWFKQFDTTEILGNIDFTVFPKQDTLFGRTPLLWAEAKTGNFDIPTMFVQLILTIGKARTFDKTLPPAFLGAFDYKKIAFVDYINIQDIFYLNDFNWNVPPSNHATKEFQLIKERIEAVLKVKTYIFDYQKDEKANSYQLTPLLRQPDPVFCRYYCHPYKLRCRLCPNKHNHYLRKFKPAKRCTQCRKYRSNHRLCHIKTPPGLPHPPVRNPLAAHPDHQGCRKVAIRPAITRVQAHKRV